MPQSSPADLRIAQAVLTLAGADDSLESINTSKFSDRAIVAVAENDSVYMLRKDSSASPSPPDIIAPAQGGTGRWFIYPTASGGDTLLPIQNVRYVDPNSGVTPENGSIRSPYTGAAEFFTEVVAAAGTDGWQLMLPGYMVLDFIIPDVNGASIVIEGLASGLSSIGSIPVAAQSDALTIVFRNLDIAASVDFQGGEDCLVVYDTCRVNETLAGGTLSGTMRFINCTDVSGTASQCAVDASDTSFCNGNPGDSFQMDTGTLRNCNLNTDGNLIVRTSASLFGCTFSVGCSITVSANQTITMDMTTWANMIAAGVIFPSTAPTFVLRPYLPIMATKGVGSFAVNPGATGQQDLGVMTPAAERSVPCIVQFLSPSPGGVELVCVAAVVNSSGHVLVDVLNPALITQTAVNPTFTVLYFPKVTP